MGLLSKPELVKMAVATALECGLDDPALLLAHIDVRTKWNSGFAQPVAISYMTHQQFPDPLECEYRSIQWGLMAIQGEFARSEHYSQPLTQLLQPEENLREGIRLFQVLMAPKIDMVERAVAALTGWNRENNREVAAETLQKLEAYRDMIARMPDSLCTFRPEDNSAQPWHSQIEGNVLV